MRTVYIMCFVCSNLFFACQKEGCKDINAVNYNPKADINDGFCTYRYLDVVSLKNLDFKKNGAEEWDNPNPYPLTFPNEQYPDLKFYLKRKSSTYWEYQTDIVFDVQNTPVIWNIQDIGKNYLILHEEYQYRLLEEDENGVEVVLEGSFIPSQVINENKILLENNNQTTIIELNYIVS
jgi:hypothetical protein